ncbi:uncharacterized protein LOC104904669 isoform X2 [Beta vulgaris subsp. vulgaris]|uniref:uncharacterized protein LOC104904669 isoform X2 n=1 Tax=Beta vulgaris subsp. vulgaris TaxID=3555 RepID=UPI00053FC9B7|nr:uncharacterized protein LOC104904669 isoform X2 [Beta vulgaris subsp. vulgaris]
MLDGIFRSNFRTKCKSLLNRVKTRLEVIKKRRSAMQKFLKKDIAELLKSNLERNAYGRAEGLYMELNLSSCYEYVEQCCACIAINLKEMHKQSECPEQCRVAVASLIYAAARFADLPELRDLRNLFNEKYGKALEPFVKEEFMENLKSTPPTTQMKLWLIQEIAKEFSVTWDPKHLEQQLQTPSLPPQVKPANLFKNRSTLNHGKGKQVDEDDKQINEEESVTAAKTRRRKSCSGLKENSAEKLQVPNMQEERIPTTANNRKASTNKIVPAPYIISNNNEDDDSSGKAKPRPRSVRTKFLQPSASTSSTNSSISEHEIDPRDSLSARVTQGRKQDKLLREEEGEEEEEELNLDKLLLSHLGKKKGVETSPVSTSVRKEEDNGTPKFELPPPPGRRRYLFTEHENQPVTPVKKADSQRKSGSRSFGFLPPAQQQQYDESKSVKTQMRHVRSAPYLNDETGGHQVHPRLPDYDELAERIAVLKNV